MKSLSLKITLAILAVSFFAILSMGLLASQTTRRQFSIFVERNEQQQVAEQIGVKFEELGEWRAIGESYDSPRDIEENLTMGYAVVTNNFIVVFPGSRFRPRQEIPENVYLEGTPILANGEEIGRLIGLPDGGPPPRRGGNQNPENNFLENVAIALRYAALGTVIAATLLGLFLGRSLTNPIIKLTAATQAIARGDLSQRVEVESSDELGKLAESFNQMSHDLETSQRLRQQMTADIAHDLRTPLSIILGHTEALQDGVFPATKETFGIIHDEAMRLNRLIEDLRTLSLAETGELPLHKLPTNLTDLLQTIYSAYQPMAQQKQVELKLDAQSNLPQTDVDVDRMTQVFNNLLDNALRYTPEGGEVLIKSAVFDQQIQIQVSDTGAGIPTADLPHIFERFYRADKSRQRKDGGSGLGLAITKSIVEAHDGKISVDSQQGNGTTFTISFAIDS